MSNTVRSAQRTLAILQYLAAESQPVSAATIMRDCHIPRSSGFHLLNVMRDWGFVAYYPEERRWGLGQTTFEISSAYFRARSLERLARPILSRLVDSVHEAAHLGILQGSEVLYVAQRQPSTQPQTLITEAGVRLPASLTAIGKAILMHESESQVRAIFPESQPLIDRTGRGPKDQHELVHELSGFRDLGYAFEDGQTARSTSCIAAAVFDSDGHPTAALGISFWTPSYDGKGRKALAEHVRAAAAELSSRLWWRGGAGGDMVAAAS